MLDEHGGVDFEYEGEMPPELALDPSKRGNYPFMRLTGPANVLIMPAIHSAAISTKLVQALGGADGDRAAPAGPGASRCRSARCRPRCRRSCSMATVARLRPAAGARRGAVVTRRARRCSCH